MLVSITKYRKMYLNQFLRNISLTCVARNSIPLRKIENLNDENSSRRLLKLKNNRYISANVSTTASDTVTNEIKQELMASYHDTVKQIINIQQHSKEDKFFSEYKKRFRKVLEYNVPTQTNNPDLTLLLSYKYLAKPGDLTPDNIRLANILSWCTEMWVASIFMFDDIMDNSEERRGMPCWHRVQNVGLNAVNDTCLVNSCFYALIKKHFQAKSYYVNILELFNEGNMNTFIGQGLDMTSSSFLGKPNLNLFTMDRYKTIVKYKSTSFIQLPLLLALCMAEIKDPELYKQAKIFMAEIGHFMQVKNDFNDCFDDEKIKGGKSGGDDIKEGKCSWIAVVALKHATSDQRKIMEQCYGSSKPDDVAAIKDLYERLNIPHIYANYKTEHTNIMYKHIQEISKNFPSELLLKLMQRVI